MIARSRGVRFAILKGYGYQPKGEAGTRTARQALRETMAWLEFNSHCAYFEALSRERRNIFKRAKD